MKLKVAVLMGGPSAEREVSLVTGKAIFDNLSREKYLPTLVEMSKDGKFFIVQKNRRVSKDAMRRDFVKSKFNFLNLAKTKFDLVFIAMHGTPGEDGGVQGLLETLGVKYTGSGVLASALAMNKIFSSQIYSVNSLPYLKFIHFKKDNWKKESAKIIQDIVKKIVFPVIIKPVDQGSAIGVNIVKSKEELKNSIDNLFKSFSWLMVQRFVKGQEATCGVLEKDGEILALPPTHILPKMEAFYDYASKYKTGGSVHICPADFGDKINLKIQQLAIGAHKALGCKGMSRTDILIEENGSLYILETNTIPGMTPTSLLPEAASKAGISFSKMLDYIIKASL